MSIFNRMLLLILLFLFLSILTVSTTHAHLMQAHHGTLNIVDDGAFMVLSLPLSAFDEIDQNLDGRISPIEFNHGRAEIIEAIREHIALADASGLCALEGIMLSPAASHDSASSDLTVITVMGRFSLHTPMGALTFKVDLFDEDIAEQALEIKARRGVDEQITVFELSPERTSYTLFR